jgi:hypothetical protein
MKEKKEKEENIFSLEKLIIDVKSAEKASQHQNLSGGSFAPSELPEDITPPEYNIHKKQYDARKKKGKYK